jgi:hypothetical protein
MEPMDFIGSYEGRWQRNEVAQSKDKRMAEWVLIGRRSHHRADGFKTMAKCERK